MSEPPTRSDAPACPAEPWAALALCATLLLLALYLPPAGRGPRPGTSRTAGLGGRGRHEPVSPHSGPDDENSGRAPAEVQYQLYYKEAWKIYDIRIEGISLALTYRTSFGEQINREGLDQLIAQLTERNRKGEVELPETATKK